MLVTQLCEPMDCSPQAPLPMGFAKQEYWSGLPFPSPGDLPNLGIESGSPALQAGSLLSGPPGKLRLGTFIMKWKLFNIRFFMWLPLVIAVACMISFASCRILHWRHRLSSCSKRASEHMGFRHRGVLALLLFAMSNLSSPTKDQTHTPCLARRILDTGPPGKSLNESLAGCMECVEKSAQFNGMWIENDVVKTIFSGENIRVPISSRFSVYHS